MKTELKTMKTEVTEALYKHGEIDKSSNSEHSVRLYPQTKRQAIDLKDKGEVIGIEPNMGQNLINYFQSIGADKDLPTDKNELVGFVNRFHNQVAVSNPLWPEELPFGFVYGAFLNAIMYDRVELKGYNIKAHIGAFKRWITQSGVEDKLIRSYYNENPEEEPKKIKEKTSSQFDNGEGLLGQSPEDVLSQIKVLQRLHGSFEDALESVGNAKAYRRKLQKTYEHYKQQGYYED